MKGYHVERRFGWDTHGLPIEHEIDKKLGISGRDAIWKLGLEKHGLPVEHDVDQLSESDKAVVWKLGLAKYNEECRAIVMRFSQEWRVTIDRLGRWIDFDNDYKVGCPSGKRCNSC